MQGFSYRSPFDSIPHVAFVYNGVGAQILRDLGVTSIRHLTSSAHDYKGLSGFGIEIVSNEHLEG